MNISTLINILEEIKKEHGDIPIVQHGHSHMITIEDPKVNVMEMTEKIAQRILWGKDIEIEPGEVFAWL